MVLIETLEIINGFVAKRDYDQAIAWARDNREVLANAWASLNS